MELEARDVTFYYPGKKKHPVLDHVNLTIAPGERVGLKGKAAGARPRCAGCWRDTRLQKGDRSCWTGKR